MCFRSYRLLLPDNNPDGFLLSLISPRIPNFFVILLSSMKNNKLVNLLHRYTLGTQLLDCIIQLYLMQAFFRKFYVLKSQAINAKLYLRNIISSFCTTMFAFCWQICTDCPSFRFALCLFYSFYASLASSFWNSSPEVFHPNISLG